MDGCIFSRELEGVMNYRNIPTLSVKFYNFYPAHFLSLAHLPRVTVLKILRALYPRDYEARIL